MKLLGFRSSAQKSPAVVVRAAETKSAAEIRTKSTKKKTPIKTPRSVERRKSTGETPTERSQSTPKQQGRYGVGDARKSPTTNKSKEKKSEKRDDDGGLAAYPLIDRIPTAIGYHSDESEDEWLEEKSKCSRYDTTGHQFSEDEEEEREDHAISEEEREDLPSDEEPEDMDDRYSQKSVPKKKTKSKKVQPDTIDRLWSESTDSDVQLPHWSSHKESALSNLDGSSYPEEKGEDPIYEGSPKNQRSKKRPSKKDKQKTPPSSKDKDSLEKRKHRVEAPIEDASSIQPFESLTESPTGRSDASSLTDPLTFDGTTSKVVKEIEQKLKLLKRVAAKEQALAKKSKKIAKQNAKLAPKSLKSKLGGETASTPEKDGTSKTSAPSKKISVGKPTGTSSNVTTAASSKKISVGKPTGTSTNLKAPASSKITVGKPATGHISKCRTKTLGSKERKEPYEAAPVPKPAAAASPKITPREKRASPDPIKMTKSRSKDQIELARSMSMVDSVKHSGKKTASPRRTISKLLSRPKRKNITAVAVPTTESIDESEVVTRTDTMQTESTKKSVQVRAMYTKSLLTEDSDVDLTEKSTMSGSQLTTKPWEDTRTQEKPGPSPKTISPGDDSVSKLQSGLCLSPSWKFGSKAKGSVTTVVRKNAGSFWKKRAYRAETMTTPSHTSIPESRRVVESGVLNQAKASPKEVQPAMRNQAKASPKEVQPAMRSTSPKKKKKKTGLKELDEYSGATKETKNDPDVVECLRFYSCGAVANQVNVVIKAVDCVDMHDNWDQRGESNDVVVADESMKSRAYVFPSSPNPTVEVVLEENSRDATQPGKRTPIDKRVMDSFRNSMSCHNDDASDDFLAEVPPLPLSRVPSIVVDVTEMQLHLDGDSEVERKASVHRGESGTRSDISITSINVPNRSTDKRLNGDGDEEKDAEKELELKDYIEKNRKSRGIRGFIDRIKKRKGIRCLLSRSPKKS